MHSYEFEATVKVIHDNLYASSNIRTPEELQDEFTKVLLACQEGQKENEFAFALSAPDDHSAEHELLEKNFESYRARNYGFSTDSKINLDPRSAVMVARALMSFDLLTVERDWLGDALEVFRSTAAKRLGGQFFTDQRVTDLAVDLLGFEPSQHVFVDTCAGTGGFLIAASRKIGGNKAKGIYGIEIDSKLSHLSNATLKHLRPLDDLQTFTADSLHHRSWTREMKAQINESEIDMIASNPPFGAKIVIRDKEVLEAYDLARIWALGPDGWEQTPRLTNRAPDILFLERNLRLVKPGTGRIALVLPYQILSGPRTGYVREWLLRHAKLVAIIDLPDDTFQPWTGTKTALVVAERRAVPLKRWDSEDYPIFMAVSEQIGHDRRGNPVLDENGVIVTDLPSIQKEFASWRTTGKLSTNSNQVFVLSAKEISKKSDFRMNAAFYNLEASRFRNLLVPGRTTKHHTVHKLGDLVSSIECPGRFKRRFVKAEDGGIPFLGGSNIVHFSIATKKFLAADDPHLPDVKVKSGWLLVTRSGSTGIVSSVPPSWDGVAMSDHVIRIIPMNSSAVPIEYLEAYLRSNLGQQLLSAGVFGSVIDEITPAQIASLPVPVPTNRQILDSIVDQQKAANKGREEASKSTVRAVEIIDRFQQTF